MPLTLKVNDSEIREWKSEFMIPCQFCISSRVPDPSNVVVSLVHGNDTISICELCIKGAGQAVVREYRRVADAKKPPSKPKGPGPNDPKKRRVIKYA